MPRYLVERTLAGGLSLPGPQSDRRRRRLHPEDNALDGATWVHAYVTLGQRKTSRLCDAPSPEAVRRAAGRSGLPVDRITEVCVLDPYGLP